jgi:hypothetical protein
MKNQNVVPTPFLMFCFHVRVQEPESHLDTFLYISLMMTLQRSKHVGGTYVTNDYLFVIDCAICWIKHGIWIFNDIYVIIVLFSVLARNMNTHTSQSLYADIIFSGNHGLSLAIGCDLICFIADTATQFCRCLSEILWIMCLKLCTFHVLHMQETAATWTVV